MAKKSKPPHRPKPARTPLAKDTSGTEGTWSRLTGRGMGQVRTMHNRAMAARGYRPRGSR